MSASEACCFSHWCWFIYPVWPLVPLFHVCSHFCLQSMWHQPHVIILCSRTATSDVRREQKWPPMCSICGVSGQPVVAAPHKPDSKARSSRNSFCRLRLPHPVSPKEIEWQGRTGQAETEKQKGEIDGKEMTGRMKDDTERHPVTPYLCRFQSTCVNVFACVCWNVCLTHTHTHRLYALCACLFNICMSGIGMHIYAYVRMGCTHLSAHRIRVCVSVSSTDKDMKEEGPPWCLYVTQRRRGNDSSLSPTQGRQRRSMADFSCFSAFFSPSSSEM